MPGLTRKDLPEAPAVTTTHAEPLTSPRVEKLVSLLRSCIPPTGHRHGFYLALTGFFAKQLLPQGEAKAVVIALCEWTGALDKISERLGLCEKSYAKQEAGEIVGGVEGLEEALSYAVGSGAKGVIAALANEITPIQRFEEKETQKKTREKTTDTQNDEKLGKISQNVLAFRLKALPDWQGVIAFDVFKQDRVAKNPPVALDAENGKWTDTDTAKVKNWFEVHQGVNPSLEMCESAIDLVAKDNQFNSVVDYLEELPKASGGSIDSLASAMGLQTPIERKMLRIWLISAVARAYHPGEFVKGALCMQGPQNVGKTTFLRIMFGDNYRVSIRGDLSDDKTVGEKVVGSWVVELEEAHAVKRTDKDALKQFISNHYDTYRPAYARAKVQQLRTCVIAITTNQQEFLDDETGNVRFYCVRIPEPMDLEAVRRLRDQVWAEARDAYKAGEAFYLKDEIEQKAAAEIAKEYELTDPLEEWVTEKITGKDTVSVRELIQLAAAMGSEVLANIAAKERFAERRFARALVRAGCRRRKSNGKIIYDVPEELAIKKPVKNASHNQPHPN